MPPPNSRAEEEKQGESTKPSALLLAPPPEDELFAAHTYRITESLSDLDIKQYGYHAGDV